MKIRILLLTVLVLFSTSCTSRSEIKPIKEVAMLVGEHVGRAEPSLPEPITNDTEENIITPEPSPLDVIISEMTTEELVGQLFLARNPKNTEDTLKLIDEMNIGGIIFFAGDFKNSDPDSFLSLTKACAAKADYGLFTAVDEEGGSVVRASLYKTFRDERFLSPMEIYESGGIESILADTDEKCRFLSSIGINLNLSPVADISTDDNDFIYDRSLGRNAAETSEYISAVVTRMNENGMMSALKHFPGYGNNADTHTGIAHDERDASVFIESDFLPFSAGIKAGSPIVLVSHNIVHCFDAEHPASLSESVITLLRSYLDFDGIVMTDDLSMGAIKEFSPDTDPAVLALLAGCDLLCSSDVETQYSAVIAAVKSGILTEERLRISVKRILEAKIKYGIFTLDD